MIDTPIINSITICKENELATIKKNGITIPDINLTLSVLKKDLYGEN